MSEQSKNDKPVNKRTADKPADVVVEVESTSDPLFDPSDLRARAAEFFAADRWGATEVAGGLHGQTQPLSLAAARKRIADWLGQPVQDKSV